MLHAVIMAGGAGTRFWPASRASRPKQLLDLGLGRSMIQATSDRLSGLADDLLVITNRGLVSAIREQLAPLSPDRIIGEPCKRDTAPCIGLAAMLVLKHDPEALMLVLPADHVIRSTEQFQSSVRFAQQIIHQNPDRLVTFGIKPTYPADVFGYIERGDPIPGLPDRKAQPTPESARVSPKTDGPVETAPTFIAQQFREKPSVAVAQEYLKTGRFYWNSGIFVWSAQTILSALRNYEPEMFQRLHQIAQAYGERDFDAVFEREFAAIQPKSIDYAIMEKYSPVVVIEAPFSWDDVGSWRAAARIQGADADGNSISGRHLGIDTRNCIIRSEGEHLIVTLGAQDLIVVHTPDATLVARKDDEEALRQVVQMLSERDWKGYL